MSLTKKDKEKLGPSVDNKDAETKFFEKRKKQLMDFRRNAFGINVEDLMRQADRDYELRPLTNRRDQTRGLNLRETTSRVNIRTDDWQSDNSDAVTFSKIQTALSLLFDRNPGSVLSPKSKRFVATTELAKAIFEDSQYKEKFKDKLKVFVLNQAKYGFAFGRTIIKETERTFEDLVAINPVTGEKKYEKVEQVERRVNFKSLNPWNVWVDDRARPYEDDSVNDWMWREVYTDDALREEFGTTKDVEESIKARTGSKLNIIDSEGTDPHNRSADDHRDDLNEVFFYENKSKDMVLVFSNGKKIHSCKLPVHKKLSLVTALWNMRNDLTIYGVGIPEILRQDKNLLDKIRNMNVDQLVLSIYKMFFYDGTLDSEDSSIRVRPGVGQRVLDPAKLRWLEVPTGGQEATQREEMLRANMEESTGINKSMAGTVVNDPGVKALALQQAKEAALAKLKTPLDNIIIALEHEASLRWALIQELNMLPTEVEKLVDPKKVEAYLDEIEHNQDLFFYDEKEAVTYALHYPEISAKIKKAEDGTYKASEDKMFFHVTPDMVRWQGDINFTAESILVVNKELQKQMDLDMANLLIPLLVQDPAVMLKPAKQILKIYGKEAEDWLPDAWLRPEATQVAPPGAAPVSGEMDSEDINESGPSSASMQAPPPVGGPAEPPMEEPLPMTQYPEQAANLFNLKSADRMTTPTRVVPPAETEPGYGTTSIIDKLMTSLRIRPR